MSCPVKYLMAGFFMFCSVCLNVEGYTQHITNLVCKLYRMTHFYNGKEFVNLAGGADRNISSLVLAVMNSVRLGLWLCVCMLDGCDFGGNPCYSVEVHNLCLHRRVIICKSFPRRTKQLLSRRLAPCWPRFTFFIKIEAVGQLWCHGASWRGQWC